MKTLKLTSQLFMVLVLCSLALVTFADRPSNEDYAIFAMGCFWCAQAEFDSVAGVKDVVVGYAGGTRPNPTYKSHHGYKEAVKVNYDTSKVTYEQLLDIFWKNIDPFDAQGQFCDKGSFYTAAIYYRGNLQKKIALASKKAIKIYLENQQNLRQSIATELIPETTFVEAESYHQDYKRKNPVTYRVYRWNCGRDARLADVWGDR